MFTKLLVSKRVYVQKNNYNSFIKFTDERYDKIQLRLLNLLSLFVVLVKF